MTITDPIADMLTRIRNAAAVRKDFVVMPHSKIKQAVAELLVREGYLTGVEVVSEEATGFKNLKLGLKYSQDHSVIQGLTRISTPGQRIYDPVGHIKRVLGGVGMSVISTSQGLMTDTEAREKGIGGEILFKVW